MKTQTLPNLMEFPVTRFQTNTI